MRRLLLLAGAFAAAALLAPELASAHVTLYDYEFPLPLWVFLTGGALAVALSAPAAAFAVGERRERTSRSFYRYFAPLHLGAIFTAFATLLLLDALAGGLFGSELFTANPLTMLVWVDFWVGLGIACALVGNLWDFVSPLNAAGRALERLLARRDVAVRRYPAWLGVWPSVVLLLGWSWTELVWSRGDRPRDLAWILIVYFLAQLVAMGVFGAELWLARGELFTVLARTFARFAPLESFVRGFATATAAPGVAVPTTRSGSTAPRAGSTSHRTSAASACGPTVPASVASPGLAPAAAHSSSPCSPRSSTTASAARTRTCPCTTRSTGGRGRPRASAASRC